VEIEGKVALIIVTYKRQELLNRLLDSISKLIQNSSNKPNMIVVVDNENSPETERILKEFRNRIIKLKSSNLKELEIVYDSMPENTGGAGGFSCGVELAFEKGAKWFWLMDDDVEVLPDALEKIAPFLYSETDAEIWTNEVKSKGFKAIQPRRLDFDDSPLVWQYHFSTNLCLLSRLVSKNPFGKDKSWDEEKGKKEQRKVRSINEICFEGGFFHRDLISKIGFPDARFFIYWDDVTYGYLMSKFTEVVYLDEFMLKRTRNLNNLNLGERKLRSSSDMTRYYMMRNRGIMWHYLKHFCDLNPFNFGIGTILMLAKETIRILVVDKSGINSFKQLWRGVKDARNILKSEYELPLELCIAEKPKPEPKD